MNRPRGTGCIYLRSYGERKVYWIKYSRNGQPVSESTHSNKRRVAEQLLKRRIAEISTGQYLGPQLERTTVTELAADLVSEYRANQRKSTEWAERRWRLHLRPFFGVLRAIQVTPPLLNRFVESRQQAGASNGEINRELAALKRAFRLGKSNGKVRDVPVFPHLLELNVRTGFLEAAQYDALVAQNPELWLRAYIEVAHTYGWRKQELLNLRIRQLDFSAGVIRLDVGSTKNREGREVTMTSSVRSLLAECARGKPSDGYVFTRADKPVRDFRKAWRNLCVAAGVPELLVHDMRRSAARNLRRAGVSEGVIMKIGGWKTRSVFERYNIVSQADIRDALLKLEEANGKATVARNGYDTATIRPETGSVAGSSNVN
jgi:integrase